VAERDPERSGVRVAILDSVWNGVGADGDRWWS
jgi:hypothetical protein